MRSTGESTTRIVDCYGEILIDHEHPRTLGDSMEDGATALRGSLCEMDTVTRVQAGEVVAYIEWERRSTLGFSLLRHPKSRNLFIGGGTLFAVLGTEGEILQEQIRCMVWGLELIEDCVLETGELECALHTAGGKCHSQVEVDPPWTEERKPGEITFVSDSAGRQTLHLPN